jgi:hypothetical protein
MAAHGKSTSRQVDFELVNTTPSAGFSASPGPIYPPASSQGRLFDGVDCGDVGMIKDASNCASCSNSRHTVGVITVTAIQWAPA